MVSLLLTVSAVKLYLPFVNKMARTFCVTLFICVLCLLITNQLIDCAPKPDWFDQLFGFGGGGRQYFGQYRPADNRRQPRDQFKPICRVISGDNYAFPGKVPFPSAPFCPYGNWRDQNNIETTKIGYCTAFFYIWNQ